MVAEADGNRTRQGPIRPLTGFEDRGTHQASGRLHGGPNELRTAGFRLYGAEPHIEQIASAGTIQARMPERSFGRTVRYRRTKIGLSQAQLGELVGRSASSIRSWERDVATPTDPSVLTALSAILDIDGRALFDKAGVESPPEETHPTVEESLASLAPLPLEEPIEERIDPDPLIAAAAAATVIAPGLDADFELEAEVKEHLPTEPEPESSSSRSRQSIHSPCHRTRWPSPNRWEQPR